LLFLAIPVAIVVAVLVVVGLAVTGKIILPGLSAKIYPIKYESDIAAVAAKYHVDPYLLAGMARTESGFDPEAESGDGALGLMQLLPKTAQWVTTLDSWKGPDNPALTDPRDSLELGACYLAYLQHTMDSPLAAVAAYNAGQGIVGKWVKKAGGGAKFTAADIPYPETKEFVRRVEHWRTVFTKAHPGAFATAGSGS
jgi:soluble lytic murein transglycosylase